MRNSILSRLRENPKIVKVLVFLTSWTQVHAYANTAYLNKPKETLPGADFHYSTVVQNDGSFLKNTEKTSATDKTLENTISYPNEKNIDSEDILNRSGNGNKKLISGQKAFINQPVSGLYISDIKEGIIGKDSEHPIDQIYDNIFNVTVNEKIRSEKQYSLEYDLYGLKDYKQVSKVINDELAVGGQNLEKTTFWTHQTEPVKATAVKEGKNIIVFTIPNSSDYSYKIRNLRIVASDKKSTPSEFANSYVGQTNSKYINAQSQTEELSLNSATLKIEGSSVKNTAVYSITALRDIDMPALTPEMVNVTADHFGYRFLPHGENFSVPAKVSIGYDKSKIPAGYTEQDIKTFYFDLTQKKWIPLEKAERDSLQKSGNVIVSKTTHFTDMVNGIIKVPESPETGSYAPNSIKDIKAANPTEGIVSIAPPTANNMGAVNTSFPIKLPAGRGGMQPSLSVNYSSEGGNGWLGLGWDLSIPSISIDTRWGVPTYDQNFETEIYTLGGEQLTFKVGDNYVLPNRNEGFEKSRSANLEPDNTKRFYPRIEGGYSKIIRHGNSPKEYWWEVISKNGTRSIFGNDGTANNPQQYYLKDAQENIGHWALYKTIDTNGNYVVYTYDKFPYTSTENVIGKGGIEYYIKNIEYTKNDSNPSLKKYFINFEYDSQRQDVQVNARLGFVQVMSKKLKNIVILYGTDKVRSYDFGYKEGAFKKSLLETITEKDANDQVFYANRLEYFNNIETSQYYSETIIDAVTNDAGINSSSLLGHGDSKNTTIGGALTFGIALAGDKTGYNPLIKNATVGGDYQYSEGEGGGRLSMTDIDGDGLPDKILKTDWNYPDTVFKYRKKGPDMSSFGSTLFTPENSKSFSYSKNFTNSFGIQATASDMVFASASSGTSKTKDFTYNYFTDTNNDGIQDIVSNGQVYFGRIDNGVLKYTTDVSLTPNPINKGAAISAPSIDCNDILEDYKNSPLHDVVKVWKAPYDGYIKIIGSFKLKNLSSTDGVKISLQHYKLQANNSSFIVPMTVLNSANSVYTINQPSIEVKQGDYFYFRVNSIDNGNNDIVELPVNMEYIYAPLANIYYLYNDSSETPLRQFNNTNLVSNKNGIGIPFNVNTGSITGTFVKPITVRDINIDILRKQTNGTVNVIGNLQYPYNNSGNNSILFNTGALTEGDIIYFQVKSNVNEQWENLIFNNLKLTINYNGDNIEFPIIPDYQFYNLKTNNPTTFKPHFAPPTNSTNYGLYAKLYNKPSGKYTFIVRSRTTGTGNFSSPQITTINWTGTMSSIQALAIHQSITQGNEYYVECYSDVTSDEGLDSSAPNIEVELREPVYFNTSAPTVFATYGINVYGKDKDNIYQTGSSTNLSKDDGRFGAMYRNWGQFIYHGGYGNLPTSCSQLQNQLIDYGSLSIDPMKLIPPINPNDSTPLNERVFIMMNAYNGKDVNDQANQDYIQKHIGLSKTTYVKGLDISTSRLGMNDMSILTQGSPINTSGVFNAPIKQSKTTNSNGGVGAGVGPLVLNTTTSSGKTINILDYFDMNGDGYPDVLNGNSVQFTNMIGMLSATFLQGSNDNPHRTDHENNGFGMGQNYPLSGKSNESNNKKAEKAAEAGINFSAGQSSGNDTSTYSYIDVNGDGLLDKVNKGGQVQLNLGYSFAAPENVSFNDFRNGDTNSSNIGVGASIGGTITSNLPKGISLFNASISFGAGKSETINNQKTSLLDINNDGLADLVSSSGGNISVLLNTGNKFISIPWNASSAISKDISRGFNFNIGFTASVLIPIGTTGNSLKISINPSTSFGEGDSNVQHQIADINGDGFPDLLKSQIDNNGNFNNDAAIVKYSSIGTTNLLRKVTTPSGGSWEVEYERVGNTYDMPQSKYVLKTVTTNDGFTGDNAFSPDVSKVTIQYANPYHSRRERTFYGFEKVTVNQIDTKQGGISSNVIYRKTIQTFNNSNYYLKGNLLNEKLLDAGDKIWTEKNNNYSIRSIHEYTENVNGNPVLHGFNIDETVLTKENEKTANKYAYFVALKNTDSKFYEGTGVAKKSTKTIIDEYDQWGNIKLVSDFGDFDISGSTQVLGSDGIISEVTYEEVAPGKYVIAPRTVKNTATGVTREKRADYNYLTGDLKKMVIKNQGVDYSVYEFEYDVYGNITKSTGPANSANQRFFHLYTYDDNVKTYPVKVQDAFGYTSKTQYDFRFGVPTLTEDMNLQPMKFAYDAKARTTEITGPYEMFNNIPWTIKFEYNPITDAPLNATNAQSYAITKHYDPEYTDSTINTITIADGFGKAIQVKKTGDIYNDGVKYIVAGKVESDAFGRALKTYYPTTENLGSGNTLYNASVDTTEPTINQYDVLDRVVYTKLPGENLFSTIEYGFADDVQGRQMFATTFKDELGSIKKSYTDIKGRTTSVWEVSNTGDIKTKFTHDAIGQILQVEDVAGNITTSQYDDLGRRISYKHPDSGITTYKYDPAGNMNSKTNAANEIVNYKYDYTRLKEVNYPVYPENNVKYYYGAAMDASAMDNNAVGRLWYQTDATGTQYLKYGRLGELTYQRRSVAVPDAGVYWFGTSWEYDTWNRVKKITYPDGEEVKYTYNKAGNLFKMNSVKDGFSRDIIKNLGYDKFEQRVYLQYGNGTETTYEYETNRRRLLKMYAKNSNRYFMQNIYQYDVVSNVMQVHNNAPVVQGLLGGGTNYAYGYDDLYRLTSSSGNWRGIKMKETYDSQGNIIYVPTEERHRFTVGMTYDNMHNIMSKTQKHEWVEGTTSNNWATVEPTSYRLNYKYQDPSHPHAPSRIIDEPNVVPNATCCNPDDPGVKFQDYQYDPKGNPTKILQQTCTNQEEKAVYLWDEENRLRFVDTNPTTPEADGAAIYTYDAGGERIIKDVLFKGKIGKYNSDHIEVSGETIHEASIYPSGLITLKLTYDLQNGILQEPSYTKHYFAGSQRIQSKNGNSGNVGAFDCAWLIIPFGGTTPPINPVNVSNQILQTATQSNLVIMQTNNLTPPVNYGQNGGYTGNCVSSYASNVEEKEIYWFHPDHLGSSSFITGLDGEVTQNMEYFPSGEIFVENHYKDDLNSQYKFNGKEMDGETGYYYYGARYYNPRVSLWLNVDPLAEKYPYISPYNYCNSNPVKYVDPNGKDWYVNSETGHFKWFDGSENVPGYSHLDGSGESNIPILQKTTDGHPSWGVILNPDGTVTDWINRDNIAMDGRTFKTPDGIYYTSGSRETRIEYEHKTWRTVADVLEWTSIALDVAGATTAIPTAGAGGTLLLAGEVIGYVSTGMNVVMDIREEKYGSATARTALFVLTFGLGNGINKLTTKPSEKTAGVIAKTANDKALDTARGLEVERVRQEEAKKQRALEVARLKESIRLENSK